jgi:dTDP-4-dehydrorhamnose reductase
MNIFITGASGYVGAKVYDYLKKDSALTVSGGCFGCAAEDMTQLDITDRQSVAAAFDKFAPDVVIHAAAIAHGDQSSDFGLLEKINVLGTANVAQAAKKHHAKIVYISSVAAELNDSPYGMSKKAGEQEVIKSELSFLILRPSMIIGLSPNRETDITFNRIIKAVKNRQALSEDKSWKFQPTWLDHLCEVTKLWLEGKFQDVKPVYPVVPEVKSRYEICQDILREFDLQANPIDLRRYPDNEEVSQESLVRNNLPTYHYGYVIQDIVEELKQIL